VVRREQLVALLSRFGNPTLAEQYAPEIHWHMIALVAADRGRTIGGGDDTGFYARPCMTTAGLARELRDVRGKARKAVSGKMNNEDWITAWAALPARTRSRLWRPRLIKTKDGRTVDPGTLTGAFSAPGFAIIAPRPELVLPVIDMEIEQLSAIPVKDRRLRHRDKNEQAAIEAIRNAYRALTGGKYKGGRQNRGGRLAGRFHRLGRDIDALFGTKLFAEKDSRRLR
jgi:hypothetical protein